LLSDKAERRLMEVKFWTNHILVAYFAGSPGTTVIAQYSPVEGNACIEDHFNTPKYRNTICFW